MSLSVRKHSIIVMKDSYFDDEKLHPSSEDKFSFTKYFNVPPREIPVRIIYSFFPPYNGIAYIHTDLLCPMIGLLVLYLTVLFGVSDKIPVAMSSTSVEQTIIFYILLTVPVFYTSQNMYNLYESCAVLGYSTYGHIFTLLLSLIYDPSNVSFYFINLILFCGLNVLRLTIVLLFFMRQKNIIKLLISSYICIIYLLFNIYMYFRFIRRN